MAGALPRALRSDLEMMFGASFRDVRIHQLRPGNGLGAVACTLGADIFFGAGAYDPGSAAGRDVLGHELAHILQQRSGRVRGRASRRLLEAEAAAAGRAVARGALAQVPGGSGRPATRADAAAQYYTVVAPALFAGQGIAVANPQFHMPFQPQDTYPGQIKGGVPALSPRSFMRAGGGVQIASANPAAVSLRLSANGNMAIEDADILARQPKAFYATQALITESNDRLTLLGSDIRLAVDAFAPQQRITVGAQTLLRVTPQNIATATAGLAMNAQQPCDVLIEHVIGSTFLAPQFEAPLNPGPPVLVEYGVARLLVAPQPPVLDSSTAVNLATTMRNIATPYANAARAAGGPFTASLQLYGLNQFTHPEVGEGFVTSTLLAAVAGAGVQQGAMPPTHRDYYNLAGPVPQVLLNDRTWGSHWGGVVAKDGADVVTLENYARNTEDALAGADTRYYFQMYNTNPAAPGATWHQAWTTTAMQGFGVPPGAPAAPPAPAPPHLQATHQPASPGARSFANPITMRVAVPDGRYDTVAATLYGAANLDTIKNHFNLIAGAATAQQEMLQVMKGLQYANVHLAGNQAALTARANNWTNALTNAIANAAFRQNLQALRYTRARIGAMNLH